MNWADVPNFERYEISDTGLVRNKETGKILKGSCPKGNKGYWGVSLWKNNKQTSYAVHRLVMLSFVGPRPDGLEIRHLDGDRFNNNLTNLAYGTRRENRLDSVKHGTHFSMYRDAKACKNGHEWTPENTRYTPDKDGGTYRRCITCHREYDRRRWIQRKNKKMESASNGR